MTTLVDLNLSKGYTPSPTGSAALPVLNNLDLRIQAAHLVNIEALQSSVAQSQKTLKELEAAERSLRAAAGKPETSTSLEAVQSLEADYQDKLAAFKAKQEQLDASLAKTKEMQKAVQDFAKERLPSKMHSLATGEIAVQWLKNQNERELEAKQSEIRELEKQLAAEILNDKALVSASGKPSEDSLQSVTAMEADFQGKLSALEAQRQQLSADIEKINLLHLAVFDFVKPKISTDWQEKANSPSSALGLLISQRNRELSEKKTGIQGLERTLKEKASLEDDLNTLAGKKAATSLDSIHALEADFKQENDELTAKQSKVEAEIKEIQERHQQVATIARPYISPDMQNLIGTAPLDVVTWAKRGVERTLREHNTLLYGLNRQLAEQQKQDAALCSAAGQTGAPNSLAAVRKLEDIAKKLRELQQEMDSLKV